MNRLLCMPRLVWVCWSQGYLETKYPRINMTSENVKNHHTGFPVAADM